MQRSPKAWQSAPLKTAHKLWGDGKKGTLVRKDLSVIPSLRELLKEFRCLAKNKFKKKREKDYLSLWEEEFIKTEILWICEQLHFGFCTQAKITEFCLRKGDTFSFSETKQWTWWNFFNHKLWFVTDTILNQRKREQIICSYVIFIFCNVYIYTYFFY